MPVRRSSEVDSSLSLALDRYAAKNAPVEGEGPPTPKKKGHAATLIFVSLGVLLLVGIFMIYRNAQESSRKEAQAKAEADKKQADEIAQRRANEIAQMAERKRIEEAKKAAEAKAAAAKLTEVTPPTPPPTPEPAQPVAPTPPPLPALDYKGIMARGAAEGFAIVAGQRLDTGKAGQYRFSVAGSCAFLELPAALTGGAAVGQGGITMEKFSEAGRQGIRIFCPNSSGMGRQALVQCEFEVAREGTFLVVSTPDELFREGGDKYRKLVPELVVEAACPAERKTYLCTLRELPPPSVECPVGFDAAGKPLKAPCVAIDYPWADALTVCLRARGGEWKCPGKKGEWRFDNGLGMVLVARTVMAPGPDKKPSLYLYCDTLNQFADDAKELETQQKAYETMQARLATERNNVRKANDDLMMAEKRQRSADSAHAGAISDSERSSTARTLRDANADVEKYKKELKRAQAEVERLDAAVPRTGDRIRDIENKCTAQMQALAAGLDGAQIAFTNPWDQTVSTVNLRFNARGMASGVHRPKTPSTTVPTTPTPGPGPFAPRGPFAPQPAPGTGPFGH